LQSDQSNWNSAAGPVLIGIATAGARPRSVPRTVRRLRVSDGYEPSNP
jgi:hypothetical protein